MDVRFQTKGKVRTEFQLPLTKLRPVLNDTEQALILFFVHCAVAYLGV